MKPVVHASDHRRGGPDPIPPRAILNIKLFPDLVTEEAMGIDVPVTTGIDMFVFAIDHDMNGLSLVRAAGFLSTPGSGDTMVQVRNKTNIDPVTMLGPDLLSEGINIESMEESSYAATIQPAPAIPTEYTVCRTGDLIGVDVTDAASDAHGLGIILEFAAATVVLEP